VSEYWIWSNEHQAWWRPAERGYTGFLHEAGRYPQRMADRIIEQANHYLSEHSFPNEVAIPVINDYLPRRALGILASFGEEAETLKNWKPRGDE